MSLNKETQKLPQKAKSLKEWGVGGGEVRPGRSWRGTGADLEIKLREGKENFHRNGVRRQVAAGGGMHRACVHQQGTMAR